MHTLLAKVETGICKLSISCQIHVSFIYVFLYGLQPLAITTATNRYAFSSIMLYTAFVISLYEQFENKVTCLRNAISNGVGKRSYQPVLAYQVYEKGTLYFTIKREHR